jgi:Tol biopolymer transport system component
MCFSKCGGNLTLILFLLINCQGNFTPPPTTDSKLVFVDILNSNIEIFVKNLTTEEVVQVTTNSFDDHSPVWSPDGNKIAFISDRAGNPNLFVMDSTGNQVEQLTDATAPESFVSHPQWSPNGQTLGFILHNKGQVTLNTVDVTNYITATVVSSEYRPSEFDWFSNGQKILFSTGKNYQNLIHQDLYVVELSTGSIKQINLSTIPPQYYGSLSLSANGKEIAFNGYRRNFSISLINIDSKKISPLNLAGFFKAETNEISISMPNWTSNPDLFVFVAVLNQAESKIVLFNSQQNTITLLTETGGMPDLWLAGDN